jgi:hypothetical protein
VPLLPCGTSARCDCSSPADRIGADRARIAQLINAVADRSGWLRPRLVIDEGVLDDADIGAPVFVDVAGQFAAKLGAIHGSVLLARPDGYLATHRVGFDQSVVGF